MKPSRIFKAQFSFLGSIYLLIYVKEIQDTKKKVKEKPETLPFEIKFHKVFKNCLN